MGGSQVGRSFSTSPAGYGCKREVLAGDERATKTIGLDATMGAMKKLAMDLPAAAATHPAGRTNALVRDKIAAKDPSHGQVTG